MGLYLNGNKKLNGGDMVSCTVNDDGDLMQQSITTEEEIRTKSGEESASNVSKSAQISVQTTRFQTQLL